MIGGPVEGSLAQFERLHVRPEPGRVLIVGSQVYGEKEDRRARYADAVGVDMLAGPGVDVVLDLEDAAAASALGQFDHVECMSVLEHCRRPWKMAATIEGLMRPGATLFVSVPFCWRVHAYPSDYWRFTPEALKVLFPAIEWETLGMAGQKLRVGEGNDRLDRHLVVGFPYFARTETVGFGRLPA